MRGLRWAELGSGTKRLPKEGNAGGCTVWDTGSRDGRWPSQKEKDDKWAAFRPPPPQHSWATWIAP